MGNRHQLHLFALFCFGLLMASTSHAATPDSAVFDEVMGKYQAAASGWEKTIITHAYQLFWSLTLISMVWTFGILALKKADISDFFVELIRFLGFTGFYLWLLKNGPTMAMDFIDSLKGIAGEAAHTQGLEPVDIINSGLNFFEKIIDVTDFSIGSIAQALTSILMASAILILFGLIAINMMLLTIAGWILAYAGIFFLGFGGSRWTSDIAIAYYKQVLMVGTQLMVMILVVGIGQSFLDDLIQSMSAEVVLKELGVILLATLVLYNLANKVPAMVSSIVTGHINTGPIGQTGTGALLSGAFTAAAAGNQLAQAAISSAKSMTGGALALQAAMHQSSGNNSSNSDFSPIRSMSGFNSSGSESHSMAATFGESVGSIGGSHQTNTSESKGSQSNATSESKPSQNASSSNPPSGATFGQVLARGIGELAKDKIAQTRQSILDTTLGGQLATTIEKLGHSIEPGAQINPGHETPNFNEEVAAFRDKNSQVG